RLDASPFGNVYRLAAQMAAINGGRLTTRAIDRSQLPLDGVVREGTYVLLTADAPVAFATGSIRAGGVTLVRTPSLGVNDISRSGGIFNLPVPAKPAAPFTLTPRTAAGGDGAPYTHPTTPDADAIVHIGELTVVLQPPSLISTSPAD